MFCLGFYVCQTGSFCDQPSMFVSTLTLPVRNSRDNMTCMIMHFADGSDWANFPDEMKNYDKLLGKTSEP